MEHLNFIIIRKAKPLLCCCKYSYWNRNKSYDL